MWKMVFTIPENFFEPIVIFFGLTSYISSHDKWVTERFNKYEQGNKLDW